MPQDPAHRYIAFISYRHVQPDHDIAVWLHRALERYRVPKALQHDGAPAKCGTVFRDAEELSASSDLSASIQEALRESKYLIVICSPRTRDSKWVNEEVTTFRSLGRGSRIIPLLIEAEPHESFPHALLEVTRAAKNGVSDAEIEPLAADVRPVPHESRRRTREIAKLKLLAPLLGCTYAALARREQEYQTRRAWAIASSSFVLVLIFAALSVGLFLLYRSEQRARQTALGRALVSQSQLAHTENPELQELGVLLAVEGMRRLNGVEIRTSQADQALRRTVSLQPRLLQHVATPGPVREISASTSGRFLAAGTDDGRTVLFEIGRSEPIAVLSAMKTLASRFGDNVFVTTDGQSVQAVDLSSGRTETLPIDPGGASEAVFGEDARHLATLSSGRELTIWDLTTGQSTLRAPLPDNAGERWQAIRGQIPAAVRGGVQELLARAIVRTIELSEDLGIRRRVSGPGGRFLMVTGGIDETFQTYFFNLESQPLGVHATGEALSSIYLSPDGDLAASAIGSSLSILEVPTSPTVGTRHLPVVATIAAEGPVTVAAFSRLGRTIATAAATTVRVWDARTGIERCRVPHAEAPRVVALTSESILVTATASTVRLWDCAPARDEASLRGFDAPGTLHPDGSVSARGGRRGIHLTDRDGRETAILEPSDRGSHDLVWSPDGSRLAAGRHGVRIVVWSWPGGAPVVFSGDTPQGEPLAFSPDNRYLAIASTTNMIDVIDLSTGSRVGSVKTDLGGRVSIAAGGGLLSVRDFRNRQRLFSVPDARRLDPQGQVGAIVLISAEARVADWRDGKLRIGSPDLGANTVTVELSDAPRVLAFSATGRYLAGEVAGQVRVWNAATGDPVAAMPIDRPMYSLAFSPDERDVAAAGGRLVQIWDIATAIEVARMPLPDDITDQSSPPTLTFNPDGRRVIVSNDFTSIYWVWRPRDMIERACMLVRRSMTASEWQTHISDGNPPVACAP